MITFVISLLSYLGNENSVVFISFVLTKETNQRKGAADVAEAKNHCLFSTSFNLDGVMDD